MWPPFQFAWDWGHGCSVFNSGKSQLGWAGLQPTTTISISIRKTQAQRGKKNLLTSHSRLGVRIKVQIRCARQPACSPFRGRTFKTPQLAHCPLPTPLKSFTPTQHTQPNWEGCAFHGMKATIPCTQSTFYIIPSLKTSRMMREPSEPRHDILSVYGLTPCDGPKLEHLSVPTHAGVAAPEGGGWTSRQPSACWGSDLGKEIPDLGWVLEPESCKEFRDHHIQLGSLHRQKNWGFRRTEVILRLLALFFVSFAPFSTDVLFRAGPKCPRNYQEFSRHTADTQ